MTSSQQTNASNGGAVERFPAAVAVDHNWGEAPAAWGSSPDPSASSDATVVDEGLDERIAAELAAARGAAASAEAVLVRGPSFGKYRLLRHLASGRTSHAFLARHLGPSGFARALVIKVLRLEHERDPSRARTFEAKARAFIGLHHRAIAAVSDVGVDSGSHYMVMEYLPGLSLQSLLAQTRVGVSLGFAITAVVSCAEALQHALEARASPGWRFRDVGTSCVRACVDGAIKLCHLEQRRSVAQVEHSTSACAPGHERAADERDAVFALGAMLHELITGAPPALSVSRGWSPQAAREAMHIAPIESSLRRSPQLLDELCVIIASTMATASAQRYPSCRALRAALLGFADAHQVLVGPSVIQPLVKQLLGIAPTQVAQSEAARSAPTHAVRGDKSALAGVPPALVHAALQPWAVGAARTRMIDAAREHAAMLREGAQPQLLPQGPQRAETATTRLLFRRWLAVPGPLDLVVLLSIATVVVCMAITLTASALGARVPTLSPTSAAAQPSFR